LFKLTQGFSGTTSTRLAIREALTTGRASEYGTRTAAVHGTLDRSAIELYTEVPQPYIDAGLVARTLEPALDFRGLVYLDWNHDTGFSTWTGHLREDIRTDWAYPDAVYFANWELDHVVARSRVHEPFSFCPLEDQLYATPLVLEFSGAGLNMPKLVRARDIFTDGVRDSTGEFRVSGQHPARGDFHRVLQP
jgi:hypothetical protein